MNIIISEAVAIEPNEILKNKYLLLNDEGWIKGSKTGNEFSSNSKELLVNDKGYMEERDER